MRWRRQSLERGRGRGPGRAHGSAAIGGAVEEASTGDCSGDAWEEGTPGILGRQESRDTCAPAGGQSPP